MLKSRYNKLSPCSVIISCRKNKIFPFVRLYQEMSGWFAPLRCAEIFLRLFWTRKVVYLLLVNLLVIFENFGYLPLRKNVGFGDISPQPATPLAQQAIHWHRYVVGRATPVPLWPSPPPLSLRKQPNKRVRLFFFDGFQFEIYFK